LLLSSREADPVGTTIGIRDTAFTINGRPTYPGRAWRGRSIEGLLFNSRMVQAIFDDACSRTQSLWRYPDTGEWDPDRNTDEFWGRELFAPRNIHHLIRIVQKTKKDGRRLLAGASSAGGQALPGGEWLAIDDFSLPHGNGLMPGELKVKIKRLRATSEYRRRPRPILINEDSPFL
jgi:hypothetical protein